MAIGRNGAIGCAISRYSDENWIYQLTICLYGCRKKENKRPYLVSKIPGDNCICGVSSDMKNLCHKGEPVGDCSFDKPANILIEESTTTRKPIKKRKTKKKIESEVGRLFDLIIGNQSHEYEYSFIESYEDNGRDQGSNMADDDNDSEIVETIETNENSY